MEQILNFSLSYEQLTRVAEERIRECNLNRQGALYISESGKAAAILGFWYELALHGAPQNNYEQAKVHIDADWQSFRKLIWPEADR